MLWEDGGQFFSLLARLARKEKEVQEDFVPMKE
jgi:hypothetical protein